MITRIGADDVSKMDVIVLALEDAGGSSRRVDTEDIAVAAYVLAPTFFSWRKYREHIDLDAVRVALRHATERGYGSRVGGSIKAGWHLTARGTAWLRQNGERARQGLGVSKQALEAQSPIDPNQAVQQERELNRLRRTEAFQIWKRGKSVSPRSAAAAFRIDAYTPSRERTFLAAQLTESAERVGDKELSRFLVAMERIALDYQVPVAIAGSAATEGGEDIEQDERTDRRS
jgi:hypothetical protein